MRHQLILAHLCQAMDLIQSSREIQKTFEKITHSVRPAWKKNYIKYLEAARERLVGGLELTDDLVVGLKTAGEMQTHLNTVDANQVCLCRNDTRNIFKWDRRSFMGEALDRNQCTSVSAESPQ